MVGCVGTLGVGEISLVNPSNSNSGERGCDVAIDEAVTGTKGASDAASVAVDSMSALKGERRRRPPRRPRRRRPAVSVSIVPASSFA